MLTIEGLIAVISLCLTCFQQALLYFHLSFSLKNDMM